MERQIESDPESGLKMITGDDFEVAGILLNFAEWPGVQPDQTYLVAIPNRHCFLYCPGTGEDAQKMHQIANLALIEYEEGPGSITPAVYLWNRGALTALGEAQRK